MVNYIALAVPGFLVLIGIEIAIARARGLRVYRFADAISDLSGGVLQQILLVLYGGALLAGYAWLYRHALFHLPGWAGWGIAFVGVDFFYYWWHRASHEVNLLWAAHVVHHSSEDFNFAVALRQAFTTSFTAWPFYVPLAFLGVPPVAYATMSALSTLYQFWIHTELVGTVGPLEGLVNTPMQHRVHHAINPRYLDKNYGATLMIWDRLFGTFEPETEPPVYGIVKPLRSFSPVWAQLHYFVELARRGPRSWLAHPAKNQPAAPEVDRASFVKYDVPLGRSRAIYVAAQFLLVIAATTALMLFAPRMPWRSVVAGVALVVASVVALGALVEGRRWAWPVELGRLALIGVYSAAWM